MKAWSQFHPHILVDVMGCPDPVIENALRNAAREFCQATAAIREWSIPVTSAGAETEFDLDLPSGQELVKIIKAIVNDVRFDVISYKDLPSDWQASSPASIGNKVVQLDQKTYRVFPPPVAGDVITLQIATKPTQLATTVSDDLVDRYADAVAAGAKARLMNSRNMPWSDLTMAAIFRSQFDAAIHSAANEDFKQRTNHRVKPSAI